MENCQCLYHEGEVKQRLTGHKEGQQAGQVAVRSLVKHTLFKPLWKIVFRTI